MDSTLKEENNPEVVADSEYNYRYGISSEIQLFESFSEETFPEDEN